MHRAQYVIRTKDGYQEKVHDTLGEAVAAWREIKADEQPTLLAREDGQLRALTGKEIQEAGSLLLARQKDDTTYKARTTRVGSVG